MTDGRSTKAQAKPYKLVYSLTHYTPYITLVKANHIAKPKVGETGAHALPQEGGSANFHGKQYEVPIVELIVVIQGGAGSQGTLPFLMLVRLKKLQS